MSQASASSEFDIKVTPRSSQNRVTAVAGRIKVWVSASPVDGQANMAVIDLLARSLGCPRSRLTIIKGHTSREKRIRVEGMTDSDVANRLTGSSLF
jgi:uncharacterized protein (TIGR00251 family)